MTPEAKVKAQVKRILEQSAVYFFSPATGGFGRSGVPDLIGCTNGKFVAIECKAGKGTTTLLQDREIQKIKDAGGVALVVNENNLEDVRKTLKELQK